MACGKATSLKSPIPRLGGAAFLEPRFQPRWTPWISFTRLPLSYPPPAGWIANALSSILTLWQIWHIWYSRRPPPWIASGSWHWLQASLLTSFFTGYSAPGATVCTPTLDTTSFQAFATGLLRLSKLKYGSDVKRVIGTPDTWIAARVTTLSTYPSVTRTAEVRKV